MRIEVLMDPSESQSPYPDIQLILTDSIYNQLLEELKQIKLGVYLDFKAKLLSLGTDQYLHELELFDLKVSPNMFKINNESGEVPPND